MEQSMCKREHVCIYSCIFSVQYIPNAFVSQPLFPPLLGGVTRTGFRFGICPLFFSPLLSADELFKLFQ